MASHLPTPCEWGWGRASKSSWWRYGWSPNFSPLMGHSPCSPLCLRS